MAEKTISLSNLTAYNDNIKATYQAKTDSSLATTSKTVVGAINENKTQLDNIKNKIDSGEIGGVTQEQENEINKIKNKADTTYVDTKVFSMSNMGQDVKEAMTGGSVAVVGKDTICAENIKKVGIDADKLDFTKRVSVNLFNKKMIETGSLTSNGTINATLNTYYTSDFISVPPSVEISFVSCGGYRCEYDSNKTLIRANITDIKFTTSATTAFIRTSMKLADKDVAMICFGNAPSTYQSYYEKVSFHDNVKVSANNYEKHSIAKDKCDFFIEFSESKNMFNYQTATLNAYIQNDVIKPMNNYAVSDFIMVEGGKTYSTNRKNGFYAIYDVSKTRISADGVSSNKFIIPSNGVYLRFTVYTAEEPLNTVMLVEGLELPTSFIEYKQSFRINSKIQSKDVIGLESANKLDYKKWAVLGDSISDDNYFPQNPKQTMKYWAYIQQKVQNLTVYKHGKSQTCIAKRSGVSDSMLERYLTIPADADIITVFGGTNDFGNSIPLGDINSTSDTTFYGAVKLLCEGLMKKYLGKKIAFFTPIRRTNAITNATDEARLRSYVDAIIEVCEFYGIPYLDLYRKSGLYPQFDEHKNNYMTDGLHPDNDGHKYYLADKIYAFLESL